MQIQAISVRREQYGANVGKLAAEITLSGGYTYPADVKMPIPDEMLQPIIDLMMGAVAETMRRSTAEFTASVKASLAAPATKVIESKSNG